MEGLFLKNYLLMRNSIIIMVYTLLMVSCSTQKSYINNSKISNEDTVVLLQPNHSISWPITGRIYNSINPRYIADKYGYTLSVRSGNKQKTFELICVRDYLSSYDVITARELNLWNYYINDELKPYYSRILAPVLMPPAIDEVKFVQHDSLKLVLALNAKLSDTISQGAPAVKIYTRDFISNDISENSTLYILDNIIITSKIFNAINPLFIKTLQRSTNTEKLTIYGRKGVKEVVEIELFTLMEVFSSVITDGGSSVLLIDNVELPHGTEKKLKKDFFKEIKLVSNKDEEFSKYVQIYPSKKYFEIISL